MTHVDLKPLYAYVDGHQERALRLLERFAAQPSISAQKLGLEDMAVLCRDSMAEYGIDARLLPTDGGPPVVFAEVPGASDKTLLLYAHYDVQPVDPLELWESPPFEPARRQDKLYARGVADDKDDIVIRMEALRAWREVYGDLPFTIKLVIEGEEESASPHFQRFLEENRELLRADANIMEAVGLNSEGHPTLTAGVKGMLNVQLTCRSADRDAHSAQAAVAPSAVWRLLWALATLKAPDGCILIDGFYDDVRGLDALEEKTLREGPSSEEEVRKALGLTRFLDDLTGYAWQERLHNGTTCNINGLIAGYTGPGYKTVLPCEASAKLDFRLVPEQRPLDILDKLRKHMETHGFDDIHIEVYGAEAPARTPLDDPFIVFLRELSEEFVGKPAVVVPNTAGTAPMGALREVLGVPSAFTLGGAGYHDSQIHAPNEHIRIADLAEGIKFMLLLFSRFAELDLTPRSG